MISLGFFLNVKNRFYWSHAWKTLDSSANSGVLIEDLPKSTFYSDQSDSDLLRLVSQQYLSVLVSLFDQTRVRFGLIANRSITCEATPCAFNEEESA